MGTFLNINSPYYKRLFDRFYRISVGEGTVDICRVADYQKQRTKILKCKMQATKGNVAEQILPWVLGMNNFEQWNVINAGQQKVMSFGFRIYLFINVWKKIEKCER